MARDDNSRRPRILLVEDDKVSLQLAIRALEQLPVPVELYAVESAEEALRVMQKLVPDLLVLDLVMPGMGGLELCRQMRSDGRTAFVPILMLTSRVDEEATADGFRAGTDDYLSKPYSPIELQARVARLLRRASDY